ncbi:MAG: hypothetical protein WC027_02165 [Candidatus Paceibacterota bacterium]
MKVTTVTYQTTEIELPPIESNEGREDLKRRCLEIYSNDEHLMRIVKYESHRLFNGLEERHVLRIATLSELGHENGVYAFGIEDIARQNGLRTCPESITIRLALEFERIKPSIPDHYLKRSWHVHMSPIDFKMSGDLFICGMGCPNPVFVISPFCTNPLCVEWVYSGRRGVDLIESGDPILFACL